ncbi:MAG TPA: endonuclease domain-containing protein, partial [Tepidiformaceae bacterium]|nr:endonuclease domain-containing protein [Tepidiformaceae bacterium]
MSRVERFHRNNVPAARRLRRTMTESETRLWARLRGRQLNRLKWRRQHPVGPFVLDFYCDWAKLAVEVDGGIHAMSDVAERDRDRQALLEERYHLLFRLARIQSQERVLPDLSRPRTLQLRDQTAFSQDRHHALAEPVGLFEVRVTREDELVESQLVVLLDAVGNLFMA